MATPPVVLPKAPPWKVQGRIAQAIGGDRLLLFAKKDPQAHEEVSRPCGMVDLTQEAGAEARRTEDPHTWLSACLPFWQRPKPRVNCSHQP